MNFQLFKLDLEKVEEPEIKLSTSVGSQKKQGEKKKTTTTMSASLTMLKLLTVWITANWKILRDRDTRPPHLSLEKPVCRTRSNS